MKVFYNVIEHFVQCYWKFVQCHCKFCTMLSTICTMIAYPETDMSAKRNDHTVVELSVIYNTYFV